MDDTSNYCVDVIGFNPTERLLLQSIFGLATRRDPSFAQREANSPQPVHLYLVDSDNDTAMNEFRAVHSRFPAPAVLVGSADRAGGLPLIPRPIQWARLLQCFDDAVLEAPQPVPHSALTASGTLRAVPAPRARRATDAVLVVDDNATVRKFMEEKLAPYGFSTDFAETGEQAVGLTGTKEYTCVFLDVVLPGIDGYQVCKLIKSNKQAVKRTAVVMLTSRSSSFDKLRGSLAGCDEYLTKPVDENHLLEVVARFLPSARAAAYAPATGDMPMNKSILVVDDTRSMRKMVATVLQGAGYSVEEAADGAEALEKAKDRVFDLVVTDHNMPRMNGVTLVRSLRALAAYDDVALIVLSTETGPELKAEGRAAGATGWMAKPFDPAKMLDIVRQFVA